VSQRLSAVTVIAVQRRAEAYMAVQHYSAAVVDLQTLLDRAAVGTSKEVAERLAAAQSKQRTHGSLGPNHYLVLGLEPSASAAEVKAAYKYVCMCGDVFSNAEISSRQHESSWLRTCQ
jgi:hypothetical protein